VFLAGDVGPFAPYLRVGPTCKRRR
jgi:hypothetical protein